MATLSRIIVVVLLVVSVFSVGHQVKAVGDLEIVVYGSDDATLFRGDKGVGLYEVRLSVSESRWYINTSYETKYPNQTLEMKQENGYVVFTSGASVVSVPIQPNVAVLVRRTDGGLAAEMVFE